MNYTDTTQFRQEAKIDFLKIRFPGSICNERDAYEFSKNVTGRINVANKWRDERDDWITIHDATVPDLEFLLTHHPDAEVLAIEVAVDFFLRDGTSDPARLIGLYADLRHCLFPQKADSLKGARRKYFSDQTGKIERDGLKTRAGLTSIYWADTVASVMTRLYRKTLDNGEPVDQQSVRVEAKFCRGGCQNAGLYMVADLPAFISSLRKRIAPMMHVAESIKPSTKRTRATSSEALAKHRHEADKEQRRVARAWDRYGSTWAGRHGYAVTPDTVMNRAIGDALNNLQRSLAGLVCVTKKREHPGFEVLKTQADKGISHVEGHVSIEGVVPSHSLPVPSLTPAVTPLASTVSSSEVEVLSGVEGSDEVEDDFSAVFDLIDEMLSDAPAPCVDERAKRALAVGSPVLTQSVVFEPPRMAGFIESKPVDADNGFDEFAATLFDDLVEETPTSDETYIRSLLADLPMSFSETVRFDADGVPVAPGDVAPGDELPRCDNPHITASASPGKPHHAVYSVRPTLPYIEARRAPLTPVYPVCSRLMKNVPGLPAPP